MPSMLTSTIKPCIRRHFKTVTARPTPAIRCGKLKHVEPMIPSSPAATVVLAFSSDLSLDAAIALCLAVRMIRTIMRGKVGRLITVPLTHCCRSKPLDCSVTGPFPPTSGAHYVTHTYN